MKNYLTVTTGCIDLLIHALTNSPDRQVTRWLEGLRQVTKLMTQTVRQLTNAAIDIKLDLKWQKADFPLLVQRCCGYYPDQTREKQIRIVF